MRKEERKNTGLSDLLLVALFLPSALYYNPSEHRF